LLDHKITPFGFVLDEDQVGKDGFLTVSFGDGLKARFVELGYVNGYGNHLNFIPALSTFFTTLKNTTMIHCGTGNLAHFLEAEDKINANEVLSRWTWIAVEPEPPANSSAVATAPQHPRAPLVARPSSLTLSTNRTMRLLLTLTP
jgi:hypothetical protein